MDNYGLSGADARQCGGEDDKYGNVDLELCVDSDDRRNFMKDSRLGNRIFYSGRRRLCPIHHLCAG